MNKTTLILFVIFMKLSTWVHAAEPKVNGLYATWCLTGMSKELNGELIPDKATYTFTHEGKLKYVAGFFKQEDDFTLAAEKIKTHSMGNYKIISIKPNHMVLNYGGYMYFTLGSCQ